MSHLFIHDAVQMIEQILHTAIARGASDIHIEPNQNGTRVRLRVDGLLHDLYMIEHLPSEQLIARIKVIAQIDVAQTRIAQDGKCSLMVQNMPIDIRVSTFPSVYGQKIVMRLLYQADIIVQLDHLGMQTAMFEAVFDLLHRSSGFLLVSGPTGSGKTTTLYAALAALNNTEKNIITLEDPVEYCLEGITQGQVHTDIGFGFAQGMRALLRQDPDIVLIGEMRDRETMQTAIQAALTGHQVLSTIHTTDAPSVIIRLVDMGIEPFLINASLTGVIAQRLARLLCPACKQPKPLTPPEQQFFETMEITCEQLFEPVGCKDCFGVGYKGRTGIFELLIVNDALRAIIINNPSLIKIREQAAASGLKPMMYDGLDKVRQGLISLQELMRCVI